MNREESKNFSAMLREWAIQKYREQYAAAKALQDRAENIVTEHTPEVLETGSVEEAKLRDIANLGAKYGPFPVLYTYIATNSSAGQIWEMETLLRTVYAPKDDK